MLLLEKIFGWIWLASVSGAVVGLALLLLKKLLRGRLSPAWQYALWLILLVKLLLPMGPASPYSAYNALPPSLQQMQTAPSVTEPAPMGAWTAVPAIGPAAGGDIVIFSWHQLAALAWLVGAVLVLLFWGVQYNRMQRTLRRQGRTAPEDWQKLLARCQAEAGVRQPVTLMVQPLFASPALSGLVRKRLLLPANAEALSEKELRYVFLHELCHLRHGDLWLNALLLILQALHWFNPVLWLCFAQVRRDRELYCDAAVVRHLGETERLDYGRALLEAAAQKPAASMRLLAMANDHDSLRERIVQIKKAAFWQKHRTAIALLGGVCLVGAAFLFLTGPQAEEPTQENVPSVEATSIEEALWEKRTPYVGDPAASGEIEALLPLRQNLRKAALQTTVEPYGMTVQLLMTEDLLSAADQEQLFRNAAMLMALIGNLDYVDYQITTGAYDVSYKGHITRQAAAAGFDSADLHDVSSEQEIFYDWVDKWRISDVAENAQAAFWSESPARDLLPPEAEEAVQVYADGTIENKALYQAYSSGQRMELIVLIYRDDGRTLSYWQRYSQDAEGGLVCTSYLPAEGNIFAGTYNETTPQPFTPQNAKEWAAKLLGLTGQIK